MRTVPFGSAILLFVCPLTALVFAAEPTVESASAAARKAAEFFRTKVAAEGGYLWRYSEDLSLREGETPADAQTIWVQPPGTPAVGTALLKMFDATGDAFFLQAARDAANALVRGQLHSGGWTYKVFFDPDKRKDVAYRSDKQRSRAFNVTTLDDNTTQSAVRFLMRIDKALEFKDEKIHEAALFALQSLLKAQFPNGAWPQGFDQFPDAEKFPVVKANIPEDWRKQERIKAYWNYYTLNDGLMYDMIDMLLEGARIYDDKKILEGALKAGDFLILAQLPDPQPAWAQQYNAQMHPVWARKFEPPAVSGSESQGVLRALMLLYKETANAKYLEPIPRALDYLKRSRLSDGRLARFYELKTNKPLYFTKDYAVTYSDEDMPTHYSFKVPCNIDEIGREFEELKKLPPEKLKAPPARPKMSDSLAAEAQAVIAALDKDGRWVEEGKLKSARGAGPQRVIECKTFVRNLDVLSRFILAKK
ncbi:MAG TPA: pectate lyase [Planctomycetota bacterium]|nr:pectate lyase [Planctomycetota bacterium]